MKKVRHLLDNNWTKVSAKAVHFLLQVNISSWCTHALNNNSGHKIFILLKSYFPLQNVSNWQFTWQILSYRSLLAKEKKLMYTKAAHVLLLSHKWKLHK